MLSALDIITSRSQSIKASINILSDDDGRSDYVLDQLGLKKITIIKKDRNEFSSDYYVWDAFELMRKIRRESGFRANQDAELDRWNKELKQSPDDLRLLSLIGIILEDRSRYENEGLKDYYENLYQIIDVQIRNGESPNPNGELGRFMDVSICTDNESKYLGVLARLSDGDRSKVDSKKQYDAYKTRLKNDPNEKYNFCRRYL